ncbi:MAG: hypothetical protein H0U69_03560 [Trueperaceae bacterium]|nr:hypothetical protein [Trueperaceae bacterium]
MDAERPPTTDTSAPTTIEDRVAALEQFAILLANDMRWVKTTFDRDTSHAHADSDRRGHTTTTRALLIVGVALAIVAGVLGIKLPGMLGSNTPPSATSERWPRSELRYEGVTE